MKLSNKGLGKTGRLLCKGLAIAAAIVVASCSAPGTGTGGGGSTTLSLISGSGTITVNLTGAAAQNGKTFYWGASGIKWGQWERTGGSAAISGGTAGGTIQKPTSGNYTFAGGQALGVVGGFIDVNGNQVPDDGDYIVVQDNYVVSGNATVSLSYPGSFTLISNSGTIAVNLAGAAAQNGKTFYWGASGIKLGQWERVGGSAAISGGTAGGIIQNPTLGGNYTFAGGQTLGGVGGFIDVNGNQVPDDGDYIVVQNNYVVSGNATISLSYPGSFALISNSGTITVNLAGAAVQNGNTFYWGACGIKMGQWERAGDYAAISGGVAGGAIPNPTLPGNYTFAGGQTLGGVGGFIDVNANQLPDDGDYIAVPSGFTVSGNTSVVLTY
jgi:hypothetical protein